MDGWPKGQRAGATGYAPEGPDGLVGAGSRGVLPVQLQTGGRYCGLGVYIAIIHA